jgi:ABC-2 type transport system ATP-binding protein
MHAELSTALRDREGDSGSYGGQLLVEVVSEQRPLALQVDGLSKRYGSLEAVNDVSLNVHRGEVFGLLGLNGAGKTTLISMLATERRPTAGDALLLGHSIRAEQRAVRQMIGVAPQEIALYPTLTAAENIRFFGRIYGVKAADLRARIRDLLHLVGLESRGNDYVATFSGGMKRRLNLAVALVHRPSLILLDEPTAGVDPQSCEEILNIVRQLRDDGNAILYTTHYMEEAEGLCDRLAILDEGKLVAVGTLDELQANLEFSEVIEIRGLPCAIDLAALGAVKGVVRVERSDSVVRLFVKGAAALLGPLHKILGRARESVRLKISPLSLEALFLHLTDSEHGD